MVNHTPGRHLRGRSSRQRHSRPFTTRGNGTPWTVVRSAALADPAVTPFLGCGLA
ncbi:hypothetical protein HaLaN_28325, partial [Haematococcus lacustris]